MVPLCLQWNFFFSRLVDFFNITSAVTVPSVLKLAMGVDY